MGGALDAPFPAAPLGTRAAVVAEAVSRAGEDVPCAGPDCLERVKPGRHFCERWCRDQLEQAGHEAQLLSLDEAEKRGWSGSVDKIVDQLVKVLERRRTRG